ncbi:MAG: ABC transporter substrate-binding protein [Burkholderiaceae bacterium]
MMTREARFPCTRRALLAAALLPLAGCSRDAQPALRIGTNVWIGCEPLYLARDLGRLDPARVQLVEYPSASEVQRAYRNQAIDGMVISLDELFGLAVEGFDPRIALVVDVSHGADAVIGRAGMKTMRDLSGRSVAVEGGALGAFVLARALQLSGMQPGDVKVVHLESNEQPAAFEKGQVDAAVTFDPYRAQLLKAGGALLFDSTRIPGEIVDLIAVRKNLIDERPQAMAALLSGWFAAIDHLRADPKDAARRMGVRQQIGAEQFLESLRGLHIPSREENLAMIAGASPTLAETGQRLMQLMLDAKLLRSKLDIASLFAPGPLEKLAKPTP